jgi:hypothetical protein
VSMTPPSPDIEYAWSGQAVNALGFTALFLFDIYAALFRTSGLSFVLWSVLGIAMIVVFVLNARLGRRLTIGRASAIYLPVMLIISLVQFVRS